jgi:2-octaprenyl-6-methoxyphenol hydroxylase
MGVTRLNAQQEQVEALGYVLENRWLGQRLLKHINELSGLDIIAPATVNNIRPTAQGYELQVDDGILRSKLVVLASGAESPLYKQLGLEHHIEDYKQHALVVNVSVEEHENIAFERFTPQGPLALLPLNDNRYAVVWTHSNDTIEETLALSDEDFLAKLQQHFGHRAGLFLKAGERASYPLKLIKAAEQIRPGLLVMGNGAHALHPVAGQGFNLSLRDVSVLSSLITQSLESNRPINDFALLKKYWQLREWDQQKTIGFSDMLPKLFSTQNTAAVVLRNLGLMGMDLSPVTKKLFARQAMGLTMGDSPFA